jgi:hypothetical protein
LYHFSLLYPTMEQNLMRCGIHRIRFFCGVGYNGKKSSAFSDTTKNNLRMFGYISCVVSHNAWVFLPFYPTPVKNILRCIPQCRRFFPVISPNGGTLFCFSSNNGGKSPVLYPSMEENLGRCVLHIVWNNENVFLRDGIRRGKTFRVVGCTA